MSVCIRAQNGCSYEIEYLSNAQQCMHIVYLLSDCVENLLKFEYYHAIDYNVTTITTSAIIMQSMRPP